MIRLEWASGDESRMVAEVDVMTGKVLVEGETGGVVLAYGAS